MSERTTKATKRRRKDERRQQHDDINRRHILDAAEAVFSRQGFQRATVREIASEADFSTATIYNFFNGKDDLFAKVLERKARGLVEALERAHEKAATPTEQLHALADTQIRYYSEHRDFYRLVLRTAGPSWWSLKAELDETSTERFRRALDIEAATFRAGVGSGEFVDDDPDTMAVVFLGIMQAYLTRWLSSLDGTDELDREKLLPKIHEFLDRAFVRR